MSKSNWLTRIFTRKPTAFGDGKPSDQFKAQQPKAVQTFNTTDGKVQMLVDGQSIVLDHHTSEFFKEKLEAERTENSYLRDQLAQANEYIQDNVMTPKRAQEFVAARTELIEKAKMLDSNINLYGLEEKSNVDIMRMAIGSTNGKIDIQGMNDEAIAATFQAVYEMADTAQMKMGKELADANAESSNVVADARAKKFGLDK